MKRALITLRGMAIAGVCTTLTGQYAAGEAEENLLDWLPRSNEVYTVFEAARAGDEGALQQRIAESAPLNSLNEQGDSPLHLAAACGHEGVLRMLITAGADPLALNKLGKKPAELAANEAIRRICEESEPMRHREIALFNELKKNNMQELTQALATGVSPNAISEDHTLSLLASAAENGAMEAAKVLLAAGASLRFARPDNEKTVLHIAAGAGRPEMIALLLEAGADPMARSGNGAYPIHEAIWNGRTEAAIALIPCYKEVGYNPHGGGNGFPVGMAIQRGNAAVVKAFLQAGLDPNDDRFRNEPLLIMAAKRGNADIVRLLLEAGADKEACDANNQRAADYATGPVAELLR